jgi:hypothetical protein|nr:MAG TPA: hypothetical protein [Caudoviricetes sp.]
MTKPAEEIYVIFNKKTGSIKTGGRKKYQIVHAYLSEKMGWGGIGRIGQFVREEKDDYAIAKYRLVEAKESRE